MAAHSSALAWRIPWTEPGGLQSMGLHRVGHDWVTSLSRFTFMHWRRKWQPTPVLLPGESQGQGAWWAAVCRVARDWSDSGASVRTEATRREPWSLSSSELAVAALAPLLLQTDFKAACQLETRDGVSMGWRWMCRLIWCPNNAVLSKLMNAG